MLAQTPRGAAEQRADHRPSAAEQPKRKSLPASRAAPAKPAAKRPKRPKRPKGAAAAAASPPASPAARCVSRSGRACLCRDSR